MPLRPSILFAWDIIASLRSSHQLHEVCSRRVEVWIPVEMDILDFVKDAVDVAVSPTHVPMPFL